MKESESLPIMQASDSVEAAKESEDAERIERVRAEYRKEWLPDSDGVPRRKAARIVLISPKSEIYLIKGKDYGDSSQTWWFTPGGGINASEDSRAGAVRELFEETGYQAQEADLIGPVLYRESEFHFAADTLRQDEDYFLLHLNLDQYQSFLQLEATQLTEVEQEVLLGNSWFTLLELEAIEKAGEVVYPQGLAGFFAQWMNGWDGEKKFLRDY
ncbi:MAG: NUDIX domain-containing protein [Arcanobacterium sp.]|nr:NUDIX domain-containing protein [Arcanobacterium sp.]